MNFWWVMILAGLVTVLIRLSFILLLGRAAIPNWVQRALRYVPPAVLTAIWLPELLFTDSRLNISAGNPRLLAGALAVLVAWRTRSVTWTIIAGMVALWLLRWLL